MDIGLFKKPYTIRQFGEQKIVRGYAEAPFEDIATRLNVQPLSANELRALPEGLSAVKRIKSYGQMKLTEADKESGRPGDWLFYNGQWYECVSAIPWDHTFLRHYKCEFTLLDDQAEPPEGAIAG